MEGSGPRGLALLELVLKLMLKLGLMVKSPALLGPRDLQVALDRPKLVPQLPHHAMHLRQLPLQPLAALQLRAQAAHHPGQLGQLGLELVAAPVVALVLARELSFQHPQFRLLRVLEPLQRRLHRLLLPLLGRVRRDALPREHHVREQPGRGRLQELSHELRARGVDVWGGRGAGMCGALISSPKRPKGVGRRRRGARVCVCMNVVSAETM